MKRILAGLAFLSAFAHSESFVLTESKLAQGLSLTKENLERQSKELSKYLMGNRSISKKCSSDPKDKASLCRLVNFLETSRSEDQKSQAQASYYSAAPRVINRKTFYLAQNANPSELLDVMRSYSSSEVMSWLPKLLLSEDCPQNLLVASLRMYEIALPSERAKGSLEVGYKKALKCLKPLDPYFELTHQRQGLLRYLWGDSTGAKQALSMALQAENPKEKASTLFWLGYLEKKEKIRKIYWEALIEEFPLAFHSLSASKLMGIDPYEKYLKKSFIKPDREAKTLLSQLGIFWLEALYMYGEPNSAVKLSYRLTKSLPKRLTTSNLAYIAALANKYALPNEAMSLSSFLIGKNSDLLNSQTLKYLYPTPFEKTFQRIATKIDPLLTFSVAKQESAFNPNARSPANARGLLQILPSTAELYDPKSKRFLYDIDTNVEVGGRILADLMKRLERTDFALAAYNAGFKRVVDWKRRYDTEDSILFIDLIPYTETRGYVANVLRNHYWYTSLYGKSVANYR